MSPAPATTGVPTVRPVALAAASVTSPITHVDSTTGGILSNDTPSHPASWSDQASVVASNRKEPEASLQSIASSPLSM